MKAKVICVYFLRIELVVQLLCEVKSAVDFFNLHTFTITVLAQFHQLCMILHAKMTSLHGLKQSYSVEAEDALPGNHH